MLDAVKVNGAPEEIRTPDPQIRSLVLYPAELRAREGGVHSVRLGRWQGADRPKAKLPRGRPMGRRTRLRSSPGSTIKIAPSAVCADALRGMDAACDGPGEAIGGESAKAGDGERARFVCLALARR